MTIERTPDGTIICTGEHIKVHQMLAIAIALRLYAKTGMKVNSAYTPLRMMIMAAQLTGKKFPKRGYAEAAAALDVAAKELAVRQ